MSDDINILYVRCADAVKQVQLDQRALDVADPGMDKGDLFREAMKVFIRVQAGKCLAALGGKASTMKAVPRRPAQRPGR